MSGHSAEKDAGLGIEDVLAGHWYMEAGDGLVCACHQRFPFQPSGYHDWPAYRAHVATAIRDAGWTRVPPPGDAESHSDECRRFADGHWECPAPHVTSPAECPHCGTRFRKGEPCPLCHVLPPGRSEG